MLRTDGPALISAFCVECGVSNTECGVLSVECGVSSVECAIDRPITMTITTCSFESLSTYTCTATAISLTRVRRNVRKSLRTFIHKLV